MPLNIKHDPMRGWFAAALHAEMVKNDKVWCLTGDLGYAMLDQIRDDFPDRFVNVGAAEQLLVGAGVGLALSGKIPFCYSITPFLLYRSFEWLRNYLNHEKIPVKLVGSGVDDDYKHDGISHHAFEARNVMSCLPNIICVWPEKKEMVPAILDGMVHSSVANFIALRR